jgi:two-component system, OmpR family, phosphate regulon response regulator OmpR
MSRMKHKLFRTCAIFLAHIVMDCYRKDGLKHFETFFLFSGTTSPVRLRFDMNASRTILLVDDDTEMRRMLATYLVGRGFIVVQANDGEDALRQVARARPDLVLSDQMMPRMDGLELVRRLRAAGDQLPVVMMTARGETIDRIIGLEFGCDDYVPKPFDPRELAARIDAVLRRAPPAPAFVDPALGVLAIGSARFDPQARTLERGEGPSREVTRLTSGEAALLARLCSHPHVALSRDVLIETIHGEAGAVADRAVDVAIVRLRKLVEADPSRPRHIQTVRGVGYSFIPGDAVASDR